MNISLPVPAVWGFSTGDNPLSGKPLEERLALYARVGKAMDPAHPESILDIARKEKLWID